MSKHKKKPNSLKQEKISLAHHRNEFIAHLKEFINKITGDEDIFKLIPAYKLEQIYMMRFRPVKLRAAWNEKIAPVMLKHGQEMLTSMLKHKTVDLHVGVITQISLYDYYTLAFTACAYGNDVKEIDYHDAYRVKSALKPLVTQMQGDLNNIAWKEGQGVSSSICLMFSSLDDGIYASKGGVVVQVENTGIVVEVYHSETEKIQVDVDGKSRPAHRVGWANWQPQLHVNYIALKSEELGLHPGLLLDVYIQNHAIERLKERMDGMDVGATHFAIYDSLMKLKVCHNKKKELLIEFKMFGHKTGYFRADVVDGHVLLRTFLFLTNNGTPEGEKLHQNTGIMKEDKMYLAIDKMSTFITSDIATNPRVKKIFTDAGCESLFRVGNWAYFDEEKKGQEHLGDLVAHYLKLDGGNAPQAIA